MNRSEGIQHSDFKAGTQDIRAYKETSAALVNDHCGHLSIKFSVTARARHYTLSTMYWLPEFIKAILHTI